VVFVGSKKNKETKFKLKEHKIIIVRRIVQITAFLLINYIILEWIFGINLTALDGLVKLLPILNSPRNPLSTGAGITEYTFFSMAEGIFPFLLIAIFFLVTLTTNRWFCGWICPIGTIQDGCAAIPTKKRTLKPKWHKFLLNIKYAILIFLVIMTFSLGVSKTVNYFYYLEFKQALGALAEMPVGFFSLSEFLFVYFPQVVSDLFMTGTWPDFGGMIILLIYVIILITSFWVPRFYCRYICPYAAIASSVSDYSFLKLSRNPVKCVGRSECGICENVCPKQIKILDEPFEFFTGNGECNLCLKCKEKCPHDAMYIKFGNV